MIPEKWYIKCTEENQEILSNYFHSIGNQYKSYQETWELQVNCLYVYPQIDRGWGYEGIDVKSRSKEHEEITTEQFIKYVLNKNNETEFIIKCL
jgi:sarcosine oxidase delta subunit